MREETQILIIDQLCRGSGASRISLQEGKKYIVEDGRRVSLRGRKARKDGDGRIIVGLGYSVHE